MKNSVCIETMFLEVGFEERFKLARDYGFEYIEFWTWKDKDINNIKRLRSDYGLKIASFSGDMDFSMIDENESKEYIEFAIQSIRTANFLNCNYLVLHSNALGENGRVINSYNEVSYDRKISAMVNVLKVIGPVAGEMGVNLVIEPLNSLYDHRGNFLMCMADAVKIVRLTDCKNVKILYDIYHMQIMEGNIINSIKTYFNEIGYIHIADVPGRHEPGTGEINYINVFNTLRSLGYTGFVGFELFPVKACNEVSKILLNQ